MEVSWPYPLKSLKANLISECQTFNLGYCISSVLIGSLNLGHELLLHFQPRISHF